jgi:hypothetical protein
LSPKTKSLPTATEFGLLPVDLINRTLDLELDPGPVVLTTRAWRHVVHKHPEEAKDCLHLVPGIIGNPLYIGDDFRNPGKIEFVGRVSAQGYGLLVAVNTNKDKKGRFEVTTFYSITEFQIQSRLATGHLKRPLKS